MSMFGLAFNYFLTEKGMLQNDGFFRSVVLFSSHLGFVPALIPSAPFIPLSFEKICFAFCFSILANGYQFAWIKDLSSASQLYGICQ